MNTICMISALFFAARVLSCDLGSNLAALVLRRRLCGVGFPSGCLGGLGTGLGRAVGQEAKAANQPRAGATSQCQQGGAGEGGRRMRVQETGC